MQNEQQQQLIIKIATKLWFWLQFFLYLTSLIGLAVLLIDLAIILFKISAGTLGFITLPAFTNNTTIYPTIIAISGILGLAVVLSLLRLIIEKVGKLISKKSPQNSEPEEMLTLPINFYPFISPLTILTLAFITILLIGVAAVLTTILTSSLGIGPISLSIFPSYIVIILASISLIIEAKSIDFLVKINPNRLTKCLYTLSVGLHLVDQPTTRANHQPKSDKKIIQAADPLPGCYYNIEENLFYFSSTTEKDLTFIMPSIIINWLEQQKITPPLAPLAIKYLILNWGINNSILETSENSIQYAVNKNPETFSKALSENTNFLSQIKKTSSDVPELIENIGPMPLVLPKDPLIIIQKPDPAHPTNSSNNNHNNTFKY
jgi:hypothetical protein